MKKLINIVGIGFFLLSCNSNIQQTHKEDTVATLRADTAAVAGDNIVKSEAPDAGTKVDQEYCFSRHNNGVAQSPINIFTMDAIADDGMNHSVRFQTDVVAAENLGHTVQVDFKEGSICLAEGKQYFARQFHFHPPSEHMIDGMTFQWKCILLMC
jgi:carbonic anhydrase